MHHDDKQRPADRLSRRRFLWDAARTVAVGAGSLTIIPMMVREADGAEKEVRFGYLVDAEECIGCGKCMVACQSENNVPPGQFRTWVERYVYYKDGRVEVDLADQPPYAFSDKPAIAPDTVDKAFFVPKLCNQCVDAPCIQVCPVQASFMSPDGIALVDSEHCIGCAYCVQACPYGVRFINKETHSADKCTWCYHRITEGLNPACVDSCPTDARIFGDLNDPASPISKRLREERTHVLKPTLGTHPKVRYIGLCDEVV